jgi:Mrp family chromosome partitioning ATPase
MVERLKTAIEKARKSRIGDASAGTITSGTASRVPSDNANAHEPLEGSAQQQRQDASPWLLLEEIVPDSDRLAQNRIVTRDKSDPAHIAFDSLRTRLLKALRDHGWWRVVITSPTKGCGKTTVASNLAFSLARQPETRSMLIDLDLRRPRLSHLLDQDRPHEIESFLLGKTAPQDFFQRIGANLALGLNTGRVNNPAELIQSQGAAAALDATWELLGPDVAIFDMPPMLTCDDVLAFLPNVDGVLLVVEGGQTMPSEIEECERLMGDHTNFLGVLLNKGEKDDAQGYYYYDDA